MSLLSKRRGQQVYAAVSAAAVAVLVGVDWLLREDSGRSFMAPTVRLLWASIGWGAGLGVAMLAFCWLALPRDREFVAKMAPLPRRERRWRSLRRTLLYNGWCMVGIWGLAAWCLYWRVFILPAVFAMNAVVFV